MTGWSLDQLMRGRPRLSLINLDPYSRAMDSHILVYANEQVWDEVRDLVQFRLDRITLLELDYQPAEKGRFWKGVEK